MSDRSRILYLVTSSGWGGAERYVAVMAAAAAKLGEVHVIAGSGDGTLFDRLPREAFVMRSTHLKRRVSPLSDTLAARELRRYLKKHRIRLVHANSTKAGLVASLAVMGMRKRPRVIYTAHGWAFLETYRSPVFRSITLWGERFASRRRDATIVLSEMERRVALEKGLSDDAHLHLIPLGIGKRDVPSVPRDAARTELFGDTEGFVFGTVANAYPAKALPLLINAFDRIADDLQDARLIIIGDGPSMEALRDRRAQSRHKERIFLPGYLNDAPDLMIAFDAFVLSSTKEGMPWGILEASQAGLPIIATKVGAIPEMIEDGETGLLVVPGDVDALAAAMARVHDDPSLREKLKSGSLRIAEARSEESMIKKTLKAYRLEM